MMDNSETKGLGDMNIHAQLTKGEQLKLSIEYIHFSGRNKTLGISVDSNTTLFEVLKKVGRELKLFWNEFDISTDPYSDQFDNLGIPSTYNGRILSDLLINTNRHPKVYENFISKRGLLTNTDVMNPKVEKIFASVFEQYSDNGKMSPEHCAEYVNFCSGKEGLQDDEDRTAAQSVFESADTTRDGYLTLEKFLEFYLHACKNNPNAVWSNLAEIGIVDISTVNECSLVLSIISSNDVYYNMIFSLLNYEDTVAEEAWKLLRRMPTSLNVFEDIVLMTGVRGTMDPSKRDWNAVLNTNSKYRVLYALNIIEYLIFFDHLRKKDILIEAPKSLMEYQKTWEKDFIEHGGLEHLSAVLSLFTPTEKNVCTLPYRTILRFTKVMNQRYNTNSKDILNFSEIIQDKISYFAKALSEYQEICQSVKQTIALRLLRRAVKSFRKKKALTLY